MTLPEVDRVMTHWKHYPPVRALVAAFVGFEPTEPTAEKHLITDDRTAQQIAAHFNAMLGGP